MTRFTKLLTAAVLIGAPATALAKPRTLATGAPACGNTMGKTSYASGCTAEERTAARAERDRKAAEEQARREQLKHLADKADTVVTAVRLTLEPLLRLHS